MSSNQPLSYEEIQELDEDEREEYFEQRQADLDAAIAEEQADLSAAEAAALDAITAGTDIPTETVTLGDAEIEVRAEMSGTVEDCLMTIAQADGAEDIELIRETCLDGILHVIVDDNEPESDPFDFTSREVWRAYCREHGTAELCEVFHTLAEPATESMEMVDQFRQER